jgi:NADH dehydrogenase FAD-containing subunit
MSEQRPNVVVLGGGYGGIRVAKPLDAVADVTLVDPTDAFLHNVAAWRALVAPEWIERIFFPYDRLLARGRFVRDRAVAVAGRRVTLGSGDVLEPDYLVLATGSAYPFPAKTAAPDLADAQTALRAAHAALAGADRVLIVGAGPAGLELAGEIRAAFPAKHVTVADRGADILPGPYDPALRAELRRQLDALGVELVLGSPLRALPGAPPAERGDVHVATEDGAELRADIWFRAFGTAPDTGYLRGTLADAVGPDGRVRVDEHLRVAGHDRVFAIGDLAAADRPMAGMAGAQADLLAANLAALITGDGEATPYAAWPPVIALPLGPEGGAGQLPGVDGIAGAETIAEVKGRHMLVDGLDTLFDVALPVG